jgi:hypothetical protein
LESNQILITIETLLSLKNFFTLFSLGLLLEDLSKHMREANNSNENIPNSETNPSHKLYIYSTVNLKKN